MKRMKLAIICHFSTSQIRERLELVKDKRYKDFGLWNVNIIDGLKKREDIELHVISPHSGMKRPTQEFLMEDVNYHFFRKELPYPWEQLEFHICPQKKRNYSRNRRYVKSFIKNINPDLINLVGAENPYYSITALDIENIPIIIHCQTVYANPDRIKNTGKMDQYRWDIELKLFHKTPYIACNGRMYYHLIKQYAPDSIVFPRRWPSPQFPIIPEVEKKYDFVFFARELSKNKGFDNAVEAMGQFVRVRPEATFLAVGEKDSNWNIFENRIKELGLEDSVITHDPIASYREMLEFVRQGRFALLPLTMDVISGTVLESMRMGMPVITCRTSGTPSLNEERETVLISEIGDSEGLCQNMLRLYDDKELQEKLINNGFIYIKKLDEKNAHNREEMIAQYWAVVNHYYHNEPIPEEMLFKEESVFM